jgi:hypothetical protein
MMYYVNDGILLLTLLVVLFKVDLTSEEDEKTEKTTENTEKTTEINQETGWRAVGKLINIPSVVLFFGVFITGFQWGIHDTFLFIYLQRDLGASSQLISYMSVIGIISILVNWSLNSQWTVTLLSMDSHWTVARQ